MKLKGIIYYDHNFIIKKYNIYLRSIHDSICVVKRTLESGSVVAGGGAVEMALNIHLEDYARTLESNE
jgi:chaperonin GroEL (HSP60 family)